jgi:hypothetical protein
MYGNVKEGLDDSLFVQKVSIFFSKMLIPSGIF